MGLSTAAEVNDYMKTRSYVEGYAFSAKDVEVFGKIGLPDQKQFPHAYRWYVHTAALSGSKCLALVAGGAGSKPTPAPAKAAAPKKAAPAKPAPAAAAEEEDDDDFWGDDEEQTEEEKAQADVEDEEATAPTEEEPCMSVVGPLKEPDAPQDRTSALYLYRTVVPGGYPTAFTNPLVIDRAGDGFEAPGLTR